MCRVTVSVGIIARTLVPDTDQRQVDVDLPGVSIRPSRRGEAGRWQPLRWPRQCVPLPCLTARKLRVRLCSPAADGGWALGGAASAMATIGQPLLDATDEY